MTCSCREQLEGTRLALRFLTEALAESDICPDAFNELIDIAQRKNDEFWRDREAWEPLVRMVRKDLEENG